MPVREMTMSQGKRRLAGRAGTDKRIQNPIPFIRKQLDEPFRKRGRERGAMVLVPAFGG